MGYDWTTYQKAAELYAQIERIEEEAKSTKKIAHYNELVDERNKIVDEYMEARKEV